MNNNRRVRRSAPKAGGGSSQAAGKKNPKSNSDAVPVSLVVSRKTSSFAGSEIIAVLVGKDGVKYYLHKDKLTSECPFFAKCLGSGMKEAQTNEVKLPEDDVEAFDCFVDWIYKEPMPNISVGESVIVTMKAWVLAEKLCMPKWQNALIDHLAHIFTYFPVVKASHLSWINDNVPTPSPLSNFMRDYFAHELAKNAGAYRKKQESELGLDEGL